MPDSDYFLRQTDLLFNFFNIHLYVLSAVSLVISISTLMTRLSFDDYRCAPRRQGGDVDGRPANCPPPRASNYSSSARWCQWSASPRLDFTANQVNWGPAIYRESCSY
jgi:hypothetical protein